MQLVGRLRKMEGGSAKYGCCGYCNTSADPVYALNEYRVTDQGRILYGNSHSPGHKDCLMEQIDYFGIEFTSFHLGRREDRVKFLAQRSVG